MNRYLLCIPLMSCLLSYSQVTIENSEYKRKPDETDAPNPAAILEIRSNDKGILLPRMTTKERNAITENFKGDKKTIKGLIVFDTDINSIVTFDGEHWNSSHNNKGFPKTYTDHSPNSYKSCKEILDTNPDTSDGEYTLEINEKKFKTYCDMTGGGYTLIWSYSDKTSYHEYEPKESMEQNQKYKPSNDLPLNFPAIDNIPYENYRIPKEYMEAIGLNKLKTHITENPKTSETPGISDNPDTPSTKREYYVITEGGKNILPLFGQDLQPIENVTSTGKLGGYPFEITGGGKGILNNKLMHQFFWSHSGGQALHLNLDGRDRNKELPKDFEIAESNNFFGWFGEENHKNGIFGVCPNRQEKCTGKNLKPHEKPRYIQWFLQ